MAIVSVSPLRCNSHRSWRRRSAPPVVASPPVVALSPVAGDSRRVKPSEDYVIGAEDVGRRVLARQGHVDRVTVRPTEKDTLPLLNDIPAAD